jgi:tetracycline 7-halogenase / FADH2 O2-dependent halogenase
MPEKRGERAADRSSEHSILETDVVILGSGLAGSVTALCLVRQGLRVMILEKETHPRFALGESTTTPSSLWLKVLAERFNAPELHNITTGEGIRRHVAPTSGVKTNFGFLYHQKGSETFARSWQALIPGAELSHPDLGLPPSSEMHFFRQDIDAYLWFTALGAGALGRSGTNVTSVSFREDGATVETSTGESIHCAFVIDASGQRSVLASALALRDEPPRMRTNSRAIFTHMVGVIPYEDVDRGPKPVAPWSQGTLHHFFDGGWVWVIPFGNYPGSQNKLCSVGLSYDNRRFPRDPRISPEEAWSRFLEEYPAIRRQFKDAVSVRPWVATGRLQYTSSKCVGDRYWLTAHAAGAVDALYSFGNINIFQSIATGVRLVLEAFQQNKFREQHFQPLQRLTDNLHRFQDRIVYGSYVGMRSPELLELWFTIWGLTDGARVREVLKPIVRYARTKRLADLCSYDARPEDVLTGFGQATEIERAEAVLDRLDEFCDIMQELEDGKASVAETEVRLRAAMESDDRFDMHIEDTTKGLGRNPWIFEPLSRYGVKAYSSAFLTPDEVLTLGVQLSPAELRDRAKKIPLPWTQERKAFEAQAEALLEELAAHRAQATVLFKERDALLRDRDAWRERATSAEAQVARALADRVK